MTPFAVLANGADPRHDELPLGLAAELGCPPGTARERLEDLAAALPRDLADPARELDGVRAMVAGLHPVTGGPLLLPLALDGGGDPVAVAVAASAAAALAGLPIEPVGSADGRLFLAHRVALDPPLVVDPGAPARLVDARALEVDLAWRCAHETALCLLNAIAARAARPNDLSTALAASALRLALPLDEVGRARVAEAHAKLLARLN
jgi:hypothetical protein